MGYRSAALSGLAFGALLVNAASKPVLWSDPGPVERLDLSSGPGGAALRPQPPFRFLREMAGGTNRKLEVRDARGIVWRVKFGAENRSDAFSSRVAWACGYYADPIHIVPEGRIEGVHGLGRAKRSVKQDGSFRHAVMETTERRYRYMAHRSWAWNQNPFVGTHELNGLKIVMMLVSNWDNKDIRDEKNNGSNLGMLEETRGRRKSTIFYVNDWGESLGSWGRHNITHDRWNCAEFSGQSIDFVKGVRDGHVQFGFSGQHTEDFMSDITVDDVRWIMKYLGRIQDAQLLAGLRAAGADEKEAACFAGELRARIGQLLYLIKTTPKAVSRR